MKKQAAGSEKAFFSKSGTSCNIQAKIYLQEELLKIHKHNNSTMIMVTHDIEEAIYLADRIIVMTPRPGKIREIVPVNLMRPRDRNHPAFVEIKRHIFREFFATAEQRIEYFI